MIGKIALGTPFGASEEEREQLARSADTNVIDDEIKAVVLNLTEPDLSKRWNTIDLLSFLSQRTHLVDGARPLKHIFHDTLPVPGACSGRHSRFFHPRPRRASSWSSRC
jgi:hypothetical protein